MEPTTSAFFIVGNQPLTITDTACRGSSRAVGDLPGVTVSSTSDVTTASLFADEYCGAGTSLILYLKAGSVVTRSFTAKDTHSPKGDVLVVYSGARAGFQKYELARKTELVLGSVAPSFTRGTDLLLPVGANQDLRELVLRPGGDKQHGTAVDPELVDATMQVLTDLDDVFAVPQVADFRDDNVLNTSLLADYSPLLSSFVICACYQGVRLSGSYVCLCAPRTRIAGFCITRLCSCVAQW